jgi:cbb3-type cytochrome c oxidase subunit III
MRRLRVLLAVAYFTTALSLFCPPTRLVSFAREENQSQPQVEAAKLFDKNCAKCHGKDGRAKTFRGKITGARNLTDDEWQARATDEQIKEAIKKGPDEMPAFEKKLSEAEIDALAAYVRHFKGTAPKK